MFRVLSALVVVVLSLACQREDAAPVAAAAEPGPSSQPASIAQPTGDAAIDRGTTPTTRDQVDGDGIVRRGGDLTATAALSVADCVARSGELDKQSVKLTGTVEQVCAKKGCWWVLASTDPATKDTVRITAKDYGFFVPRDAKGRQALVEGVLSVKTLSPDEAAHLAEDANDPSLKDKKSEIQLEAAALELRPAT